MKNVIFLKSVQYIKTYGLLVHDAANVEFKFSRMRRHLNKLSENDYVLDQNILFPTADQSLMLSQHSNRRLVSNGSQYIQNTNK